MTPDEVERAVDDVLIAGVDVGQACDLGQAYRGVWRRARVAH